MIQPVSEDCFSGAYHCEKDLNAAIGQAETPTPIRPRPMARVVMLCADAKIAAPVAAINRSTGSTRRAPKRSSSTPSGICAAPKPTK